MYKNLQNLLKLKGISYKSYASILGVTEKTIQNKLEGKTEFTLSEVNKTLKCIFPEYSMEYLFNPSLEDSVEDKQGVSWGGIECY